MIIKIRLTEIKKPDGTSYFVPIHDEFNINLRWYVPKGGFVSIQVETDDLVIEETWDEEHTKNK